MRQLGLILFVSIWVSGCGMKLESKTTLPSSSEPTDITGITPTENIVRGTSVDAKISVTPSSQTVRGLSVGAKISVQ